MKDKLIGTWKIHEDGLINGHKRIEFSENTFRYADGGYAFGEAQNYEITERYEVISISGLRPIFQQQRAELLAINEKCAVLKAGDVIHVLLRTD